MTFSGIAKIEVTVAPEDLDELEHVNNTVYMRWMEKAARGQRPCGLAHGAVSHRNQLRLGRAQALDRVSARLPPGRYG